MGGLTASDTRNMLVLHTSLFPDLLSESMTASTAMLPTRPPTMQGTVMAVVTLRSGTFSQGSRTDSGFGVRVVSLPATGYYRNWRNK